MSVLTYRLLIDGRVQGVGFRRAFYNEAIKLGLNGWVRNLSDGRVEAIIQGRSSQTHAMIAWAHCGSSLSRVDQVLLSELSKDYLLETGFFILSSR